MINLNKKRIMLLWFFSIMIMNIFIFLPLESTSTDSVEFGEEIQSNEAKNDAKVKSADTIMEVAPIFIDESSFNNWAWAKTQPWCTGSGTALDPFIIKDLVINGGGTESCIKLWTSKFDKYAKIMNCYLFDGLRGISLYDCDNVEILNNEIYDMSEEGIYMYDFSNIVIKGNKISNCLNGFSCVGGGKFQMLDNIIEENVQNGVNLGSCPNSDIKNNVISYNGLIGINAPTSDAHNIEYSGNIIAYNGDDGMRFQGGFNNQIIGNYIHNNNDWGIYVDYNTDNNIFSDNIIRYNNWGIEFDGDLPDSTGNDMYRNFFKGNPGYNAFDDTIETWNNEWNNTNIGNYWDDYTGSDADGDGIGDSDYDITGFPGNEMDHLPIYDKWAPTMAIINPKPSQVCYSSAPGYSISANDNYTFHTWYTLDGGKTNYTDMSFTGTIDKDAWDAVGNGRIMIRFYVDDKPGHIVFQDVIVYKESLPPGLGDGADDEEVKYFTLLSPLGIMLLGGMAVPVGMILRHELKRTPKEKGRWITKAGNRIFIKGKKIIKKKK